MSLAGSRYHPPLYGHAQERPSRQRRSCLPSLVLGRVGVDGFTQPPGEVERAHPVARTKGRSVTGFHIPLCGDAEERPP